MTPRTVVGCHDRAMDGGDEQRPNLHVVQPNEPNAQEPNANIARAPRHNVLRDRGAYERMVERRQAAISRMMAAGLTITEMHGGLRSLNPPIPASRSTIHRDIGIIRERWRQSSVDDYQRHVAEATGKLDELERAIGPAALRGDVKAVAEYRALERQRARLLGTNKLERARAELDERKQMFDEQMAALIVAMLEGLVRALGHNPDDPEVGAIVSAHLEAIDV